jgi:hypothetical protein
MAKWSGSDQPRFEERFSSRPIGLAACASGRSLVGYRGTVHETVLFQEIENYRRDFGRRAPASHRLQKKTKDSQLNRQLVFWVKGAGRKE